MNSEPKAPTAEAKTERQFLLEGLSITLLKQILTDQVWHYKMINNTEMKAKGDLQQDLANGHSFP